MNLTDPDGRWPDNPITSFVAKLKRETVRYVQRKVEEKVSQVVNGAKNYVNQKIDNAKKYVKETADKIANYEAGGYMLSNGSGGSSGDQGMIRKHNRLTSKKESPKMVDASGFQEAGEIYKPSPLEYNVKTSGLPTTQTSKTGKRIETIQEIRDGFDKTGEAIEAGSSVFNNENAPDRLNANDVKMVEVKIKNPRATGADIVNNSQVLMLPDKDTLVKISDVPKIPGIERDKIKKEKLKSQRNNATQSKRRKQMY